LTYSIYSFAVGTLDKGRLQSEIQQEVRLVDQIIRNELRFATDLETEVEVEKKEDYQQIKFQGNKLHFSDNSKIRFEFISQINFQLIEIKDKNTVLLEYQVKGNKTAVNLGKQIFLDNITGKKIAEKALLEFDKIYEKLYYK